MQNNRYDRQIVLPELGQSGQDLLNQSSVLCVGAGGLGSPALLYLASCGTGTIGIIDDDTVDLSNLQRQILFSQTDVGKPKSLQAAENLRALNGDVKIIPHNERLTAKNAMAIFANYNVIIDGSDNFETKFLINDAAYKLSKPAVFASVLGFTGQISTFHPNTGGACYRCLYQSPPGNYVPNCAEAGVIGAVAGMMGSIQALEAIKLSLGQDFCRSQGLAVLDKKLLLIDAKSMAIRTVTTAKDANCPICSQSPSIIELHDAPSPVCAPVAKGAAFIDVREQPEWDAGHIDGAIHIPLSEIQSNPAILSGLDKQTPYVLYCQGGRRSKTALIAFQQSGFTDVTDIPGGYAAYRKQSA